MNRKLLWLRIIRLFIFFLAFFNIFVDKIFVSEQVSIYDSERGLLMMEAYNSEWSEIGAFVSTPNKVDFLKMSSSAIKVSHSRFHHFSPADSTSQGQAVNFPYWYLRAYEENEISFNRDPFFITATYNGKKRPVLFYNYGLGDPNLIEKWPQAVNVGDERFVDFWVNCYIREKNRLFDLQNIYDGCDAGLFQYWYHGIIDDTNNFVFCGTYSNRLGKPNIVWDYPFAQDDYQWLSQIETFFNILNNKYPDIKIVINGLSICEPARYSEIFKLNAGVMYEELGGDYNISMDTYSRVSFNNYVILSSNVISNNHICICRKSLPDQTDPLYNEKLLYYSLVFLLLKGDKSFYAPKKYGSYMENDPTEFYELSNKLGKPLGNIVVEKGNLQGGYLYSRYFEGGIIYSNWTKELDKVITLPKDRVYFDPVLHNSVNSIIVPDVSQIVLDNKYPCYYVVTSTMERSFMPIFLPNGGSWSGGSLSVVLRSKIPDTTIYYTLDGSQPNTFSQKYVLPLNISSPIVVNAISVSAGRIESFVKSVTYYVTLSESIVEFCQDNEALSEFINSYYPLLIVSTPSVNTIIGQLSFRGTAKENEDYRVVTTTFVIPSGRKYVSFPIRIIDDNFQEDNETIIISIDKVESARIGIKNSFTYTIVDNDIGKEYTNFYEEIIPVSDSVIVPDKNENYGSASTIELKNNSKALLKFDLDKIPVGATIKWAKLQIIPIYTTVEDGDKNISVSVYRLLKDWQEKSVTWFRTNSTDYWKLPGASFAGEDIAQVYTSTKNFFSVTQIDVSYDVQKIVNKEYQNFGWAVVLNSESISNDILRFYSREYSSKKPILIVSYSMRTRIPENLEPLIIKNVSITTCTNSVIIKWETNRLSKSLVKYGLSTNYDKEIFKDNFVTSHSVTITDIYNLKSFVFHLKIFSEDLFHNLSSTEDIILNLYSCSVKDSFEEVKIFPNPFNLTKTKYKLLKIINLPLNTKMEIFTVDGKKVRVLNELDFGNNGSIFWDAKDEEGLQVTPGVYFYILTDTTGKKKSGIINLIK